MFTSMRSEIAKRQDGHGMSSIMELSVRRTPSASLECTRGKQGAKSKLPSARRAARPLGSQEAACWNSNHRSRTSGASTFLARVRTAVSI